MRFLLIRARIAGSIPATAAGAHSRRGMTVVSRSWLRIVCGRAVYTSPIHSPSGKRKTQGTLMTKGENPIPVRSPATGYLVIAQPDGQLQKQSETIPVCRGAARPGASSPCGAWVRQRLRLLDPCLRRDDTSRGCSLVAQKCGLAHSSDLSSRFVAERQDREPVFPVGLRPARRLRLLGPRVRRDDTS